MDQLIAQGICDEHIQHEDHKTDNVINNAGGGDLEPPHHPLPDHVGSDNHPGRGPQKGAHVAKNFPDHRAPILKQNQRIGELVSSLLWFGELSLTILIRKVYTIPMRRIFVGTIIVVSVIAYFYFGLYYGLTFADTAKVTLLDESKTIVDILRSFVETGAIIVAGFWTYERFIKSREEHPYPKIQHQVDCYKVEMSDADLIYLSAFVTLTNEGKNKIDDITGEIYIEQVFPISRKIQSMMERKIIDEAKDDDIRRGEDKDLFIPSGRRLNFESLGDRTWRQEWLEPGQTVVIQFDFLIEEHVEVVSILNRYRYGILKSKTEFATLHSLKPGNVLASGF
jgi:hypothetical protein